MGNNGITYRLVGDYYLPDIRLSEPPDALPLGIYGRMRKVYLKKHHSIEYNRLLLTEQLYPHLRLVDSVASGRVEMLKLKLIDRYPPPDKEADGLAWAAHMNSLRCTAEEYVRELICS
jgi:hypothetical protein